MRPPYSSVTRQMGQQRYCLDGFPKRHEQLNSCSIASRKKYEPETHLICQDPIEVVAMESR